MRICLLAITVAAVAAAGTAYAQPSRVDSASAGTIRVETVARGLVHPWGMAFLPDGRMLVTERAGRLRLMDGETLSAPLDGVPQVRAQGQGGLLDVALDPAFEENRLVYLSYAEPGRGGASTALGRGRLGDGAIEGFEVLFRQTPKTNGTRHFGGRIVFSPDGHLFLTLGDRGEQSPAQDLSNTIGTIVRLRPDGTIPQDNPFVGRNGEDAVFSYGNRNVLGAVWDDATGALWEVEMGPRGGDELNRIVAGENYGWPEVSWGRHYSGRAIPNPPTRPAFRDAVLQWTPVIAPSGMIVYEGEMFPAWRGSFLIGGLRSRAVIRVARDGDSVREAERLPLRSRIRDVEEGPDGAVYLLTDQPNGQVLRLTPAS